MTSVFARTTPSSAAPQFESHPPVGAPSSEHWRLPLAAGVVVLSALVAFLALPFRVGARVAHVDELVAVLGTSAGVFAVVGGSLWMMRARLIDDSRASFVGTATGVYGLFWALPTFIAPAVLDRFSPVLQAFVTCGAITVATLLLAGAVAPSGASSRWSVVAIAAGVTALTTPITLWPGTSGPSTLPGGLAAPLPALVGCAVVVVILLTAARRRGSLLAWGALWLTGVALSELIVHLDGDLRTEALGRAALALTTSLLVLVGAGAGLRDAYVIAARRLDFAEHGWLESERRSITERGRRRELTHDARSALLTMEGAIRMLARDDNAADPQTATLASLLVSEAARLRRLIDQPVEGPSVESRSIATLIAPLAELRAAAGQRVLLDIADDLGAYVDETVLQRALANLLDNSAKYARGSATVVRARPVGDNVEIAVMDRGPGISPSRRWDIFARGVTSGGGEGLGLAICRELLATIGGSIRYEDRPGGGACFVVTVSAVAPEPVESVDATANDGNTAPVFSNNHDKKAWGWA